MAFSIQSSDQQRPSASFPFLKILRAIMNSDVLELMAIVAQGVKRVFPCLIQRGIYEVLEHEVRLELLDPTGQQAVYFKRQRVRFLQDNVIAYQDQAWGDGDIFVDYQCSPGFPVDRYREGHRYRILISLHETKNRGDEETFFIQRTIRDGFIQEVEEFQTEIQHLTRYASLTVVFPSERPPRQVTLIYQNTRRTIPLNREHIKTLPDGRTEVNWNTHHPRLFEGYILRWSW